MSLGDIHATRPTPELPRIPDDIMGYLDDLILTFPAIDSIWLFGSRANPSSDPPRDWDFLVFGSSDILAALQKNDSFRRTDIDIFIVYDDNCFESPWAGEDGSKIGRLQNRFDLHADRYVYGYRWRKISETEATYIPTRDFGCTDRLRSYRVYPKLNLEA